MQNIFNDIDEKRRIMCTKAVSEIRASSYSVDTVGQAASKLLNEYSFDTVVPIVKMINDAGFKVFSQKLPEKIGGYIVIGDRFQDKLGSDKIIVVNENESTNRQRFSLAHEFGHFLLDIKAKDNPEYYDAFESDDNKNGIERCIDRFAAELLMPTELFKDNFTAVKSKINDGYEIIKALSEVFAVPFESVKRRIEEIGEQL